MQQNLTFNAFENGLFYPADAKEIKYFTQTEWVKHPVFDGVELKHLLTGKQTDNQLSYHLVRIAAHKKIGFHAHPTQAETHEVIGGDGKCIVGESQIPYTAGVITYFPMDVPHEIVAGENGLLLFAKFFPALC